MGVGKEGGTADLLSNKEYVAKTALQLYEESPFQQSCNFVSCLHREHTRHLWMPLDQQTDVQACTAKVAMKTAKLRLLQPCLQKSNPASDAMKPYACIYSSCRIGIYMHCRIHLSKYWRMEK
jgi:hypothetical protein